MTEVTFYKWKIDKESERLIGKMTTALRAMLEPSESLSANTVDVASYGEIKHENGHGVAFGKATKYVSGENVRKLPPVEDLRPTKKNLPARQSALAVLRSIARQSEPTVQKRTPDKISATITREGVSVGNDKDADITIPEGTIDYLRKVRDLLGGGRVEITKGDLHLVIEE